MASLSDAYQRVREQTERNNAARDEGGNIFQPLFANILNELNQDLDPANVNKPLSGYGALLDSVTGFRENQIEKAADLQAKIDLKAFEAGTPLRAQRLADDLQARAVSQEQDVRIRAKVGFEGLLPTLNTKGDIDSDLVELVNKKPPFYNTINTLAPNNIFHIVPQGTPIDVSMGESIYTFPDGRKLYASGNTAFKNINTARKKFIKVFNENLIKQKFSKDRIANLAREDKVKLFGDKGFLKAMEDTFKSQPKDFATLLDAHEQYAEALAIKTEQISNKLTKNNSQLTSLIRVLDGQRKVAFNARVLAATNENIAAYEEAEKQFFEANRILASNKLDGDFLQLATSVVHRNAFAISVVRGIPTNKQTAAQNIDLAIKISMNDPILKKYKKQLTAWREGKDTILDALAKDVFTRLDAPRRPAGAGGDAANSVTQPSINLSGKKAIPKDDELKK